MTRPSRAVRERQVLAGIARGLHHAEIATGLGVSYSTVKAYAEDLRVHHNVSSAAELMRLAYEAGWLAGLTPEDRPPVELSPVRQQVLEYLAAGLTIGQIARRQRVSITTAAERTRSVRHALGARTTPHAVALGYQHGHLRTSRTAAAA